MLLLLLLPFKLLLLLQLFLRPFRGAVSFCLPTFLMPQKKLLTYAKVATRGTQTCHAISPGLSLSFFLRHLATHCDTLAVKLITLLAIPAQSPVDCSALDWFADCQRVFHLHLHLHFTSLTHLCMTLSVCACVCVWPIIINFPAALTCCLSQRRRRIALRFVTTHRKRKSTATARRAAKLTAELTDRLINWPTDQLTQQQQQQQQ